MWNLKKLVQMILFAKQKERHRQREQHIDPSGKRGVGDELGD